MISLGAARRTRRGSAVRPLDLPERGALIPWPWADPRPDPELRNRQRRRPSEFERWLPTAVFAAAIVGLIVVLLLVRMIVGAMTATPPAPAPPAVAQTEPVAVAPPAPVVPQIRTVVQAIDPSYTVTIGDTLSTIAQRYNTTVAALSGINNLPINTVLSVGQRLVIP